MTNLSVSLVEPKYRHLFPTAPELTFRASLGAFGHRKNALVTSIASTGDAGYSLPEVPAPHRETASMWVALNDIPLPNKYTIVGYSFGVPVWGWDQFEYVKETNSILFYVPPPQGQLISVYDAPPGEDTFILFPVPRYLLVQGAHGFPEKKPLTGEPTPEEPKYPDHITINEVEELSLSEQGPDGRFLGGFQCSLEILSPCGYGLARVSDNKCGFYYQPPYGFEGRDSFSYRVVTPFGQQSDAACVQLYIGV